MNPLPHLQVVFLASMGQHEMLGDDVRRIMKWSKSLPAFYNLTERMERDGLITGRFVLPKTTGFSHRLTAYRITDGGFQRLKETVNFYVEMAARLP